MINFYFSKFLKSLFFVFIFAACFLLPGLVEDTHAEGQLGDSCHPGDLDMGKPCYHDDLQCYLLECVDTSVQFPEGALSTPHPRGGLEEECRPNQLCDDGLVCATQNRQRSFPIVTGFGGSDLLTLDYSVDICIAKPNKSCINYHNNDCDLIGLRDRLKCMETTCVPAVTETVFGNQCGLEFNYGIWDKNCPLGYKCVEDEHLLAASDYYCEFSQDLMSCKGVYGICPDGYVCNGTDNMCVTAPRFLPCEQNSDCRFNNGPREYMKCLEGDCVVSTVLPAIGFCELDTSDSPDAGCPENYKCRETIFDLTGAVSDTFRVCEVDPFYRPPSDSPIEEPCVTHEQCAGCDDMFPNNACYCSLEDELRGHYCWPRLDFDNSCSEDYQCKSNACDETIGRCVPGDGSNYLDATSLCTDDDQCISGICSNRDSASSYSTCKNGPGGSCRDLLYEPEHVDPNMCESGICVNGKCGASCERDNDCGSDSFCLETEYKDLYGGPTMTLKGCASIGEGVLNTSCIESDDGKFCREGLLCVQDKCLSPEGLEECSNEFECPLTHICRAGNCFEGTEGVLNQKCTSNYSCREDLFCNTGSNKCENISSLPTCQWEDDCPGGMTYCADGSCVAARVLPEGGVCDPDRSGRGSGCAENMVCVEGKFCELDTLAVDVVGQKKCKSDAECPLDRYCILLGNTKEGECMERGICFKDSECPESRRCVDYNVDGKGKCSRFTAEYYGGEQPVSTSSDDLLYGLHSKIESLNKLGTKSLQVVIGRLIKAALGIIGSIALVMFVYAGVLWMTASGNSEREKKAMSTMVWSSLGVLVILSSYAIIDLLFEVFR